MTESEIKRLRRQVSELEAENERLRAASGAAGDARDRHYRAIFESAVDFAIIATDRDGRVTDWNTGAELIFGWSADEMRGGLVDRIFTPEDRAQGRPGAEMRCALETGRAGDERWHLRRDGSHFWARGEMMPLRCADGAQLGYIKILRDRTEQERVEEALRASEERLRIAQRAGGVGTFEWYPDAGKLDVSDEYRRIWGIAPGVEVTTELLLGLLHPDDRGLSGPARLRSDDNPLEYAEYRITRPDTGEERWIARRGEAVPGSGGAPRRFVGIASDITERKRAEAERDAILASIADGFVAFDAEWRFTYANAAAERLMGASKDELLGRDHWALYPASLGTVAEREFRRAMQERVPVSFENYYTPWGRWFDVRAFPAPGGGITAYFQDITGRKTTEAALADSEAHFRATFEQAAVGVAHVGLDGRWLRVNARLCAMLGYTEAELLSRTFQEVTHPDDLRVQPRAHPPARVR